MQEQPYLEPVALTGATGFIGKHLVSALVDAGCRPVVLARSPHEALSGPCEDLPWAHIELTNRSSVLETIERVRPATLIHLAGTRGRGDASGAQAACDAVNLHATVALLEAAMKVGIRRIVMLGSAEEYGRQAGPQHEGLPSKATSRYGVSKAAATARALSMHSEAKCPIVIVRPFSVYGPGQPRDMFISLAIDSAIRGLEFKMSLGEQRRDLIYISDVTRGLLAAARIPGIEGQVINLGSGESHRLRDVAERIWELTNSRAPLLIGARSASDEELYDTCADITIARRLLDWRPEVSLEDGLARTISAAREQLGMKDHLCRAM